MRLKRRGLAWEDEGNAESEPEPEPEPKIEWIVRVYVTGGGEYARYYTWIFDSKEEARTFMKTFIMPPDQLEFENTIIFTQAICSVELTTRQKR